MDCLQVKLAIINPTSTSLEDQVSLKRSESEKEDTIEELLDLSEEIEKQDESRDEKIDEIIKTEAQIEYETIKQIEAQIEKNRNLKKILLNKLDELREVEETSL
ncbi:hypothetical protein ACKWTF_001468 [Chironomus riparius]